MIRRARLKEIPEVIEGFRMRGTEVSRMEAFVDCVFGFGLTLLVVQVQVPNKFEELMQAMRGFVGFAFCFAIFFGVWSSHYTFCRRYGLQDATVRILTAILVFVLLAYLYPLRYLSNVFVTAILHIDIGWNLSKEEAGNIRIDQLFIIYGIGYILVQVLFASLYFHAYRLRDKLQLDELERLDTKWWCGEQLVYLVVPLTSIIIASTASYRWMGYAGYVYFLMGLVGWIMGTMHGKRHRALVATMEAAGALDEDSLNTENEMVPA